MTPLRAVLVDDEPLARERLGRLLVECGCAVAQEFQTGEALLAWLGVGNRPDAIFLDIQMPGLWGLEVLAEIPEGPPVIFVTAYSEHAVRAFELAAVDYLLKPVFKERLERCLARVREHRAPRPGIEELRALARIPAERIPVKAGEGHVFVELRRVTHFELDADVVWCWSGGKRYRTRWTALTEVEKAFPGTRMLRAQRHVLLRPETVLGLKSAWGGRALARIGEGQDLEISRGAAPKLREWLHIRG